MAKHLKCWLLIIFLLCCPTVLFSEIRVYGLQDFNLGRWMLGSGPLRSNLNICISVRPPAPYQVTAFGSGSTNAFTLTNGRDTLSYRVFFNDRPRPNGATELQAGQALGGLRGRRRGIRQRVCNRPTANISIFVSNTNLERSSAGRYSGTVIIVVGPE